MSIKKIINLRKNKNILILLLSIFFILFTSCKNNLLKKDSFTEQNEESTTLASFLNVEGEDYSLVSSITDFDINISISCTKNSLSSISLKNDNVNIIINDTCQSVTFNSMTLNGIQHNAITANNQNIVTTGSLTYVKMLDGYTLKVTATDFFPKYKGTSSQLNIVLIAANNSLSTQTASNVLFPVIGSGDNFSCALIFMNGQVGTNNKIYCWGKNSNINNLNTLTPINITPSLANSAYPTNLYVGDELICILDSANIVWCLGYWGNTAHSSFSQINLSGTVQKVFMGYKSACALTSASTTDLKCWGNIDFKALNTLTPYSGDLSTPAGGISGLATVSFSPDTVSQAAIGNDVSESTRYGSICAIVTGNVVKCIGNNISYQLGNNSQTYSGSPQSVSGISLTVVKLTGRNQTYCATNTGNQSYCWGKVNDVVTQQGTFEFNLAGYLSVSGLTSTGGSYIYATSVPAFTCASGPCAGLPTATSYSTSLKTATQIETTGQKYISLGIGSFCSGNGTNLYCYGVDITQAVQLTTLASPISLSKYAYNSNNLVTASQSTNNFSGTYTDKYCQSTLQPTNTIWYCGSWNIDNDKTNAFDTGYGEGCGAFNYGNCDFIVSNVPTIYQCFDPYIDVIGLGTNGLSRGCCAACCYWWSDSSAGYGSTLPTTPPTSTSRLPNYRVQNGSPTYNTAAEHSTCSGYTPLCPSTTSQTCYTEVSKSTYTWNYTGVSYTKTSSAGGGFVSLSKGIYNISMGVNYQNKNSFGHVCVGLSDGSIRCWGGNDVGQVGNGNSGANVTTPFVVFAPTSSNLNPAVSY